MKNYLKMVKTGNKPVVIAVHLLNDFSGSPFVFKQALQVLLDEGLSVHLLTATPSGSGFLSDLRVQWHPVFYKWNKNRFLTLCYFIYSQFRIFFKTLGLASRDDILYINTMLPFGAALAGKLLGMKIIYHIHEVSVRPPMLKRFLLWTINVTADQCIYVSRYVSDNSGTKVPGTVIYNSLPVTFIEQAKRKILRTGKEFSVLMICSLKKYKGVFQFVLCAQKLPEYEFVLVLNATQESIDRFFRNQFLPVNLKLFPSQSDVHPFYSSASLVLNLSQPEEWIETFGMTALEAMYYGRPVIVPNTGGIMELVTDKVCGYQIAPANVEEISAKIDLLAKDQSLYLNMCCSAYARAGLFTPEKFRADMLNVVDKVMAGRVSHTLTHLFEGTAI